MPNKFMRFVRTRRANLCIMLLAMLDTVGSVASIVAAITTIALFVYFVWDRRSRVRIRVLSNLVEIPATHPEKKMVSVEIINLGTRPVPLDKVFLYGPEEKLLLMKDSLVRKESEKLLTPENPSVTFFGPQDDINPATLIGVVAYDRLDRKYIHHVQRPKARVARWLRLRFTKKGRASRDLLANLNCEHCNVIHIAA